MLVVTEDVKQPNAIMFIHLPKGPTAYFKLTSIELSKRIPGHARSTVHLPELARVLFQIMLPRARFQGLRVATLHNQRDCLFFRHHSYAIRSTENAALQEIGPRFTLKLKSLRTGLPVVREFFAQYRDESVELEMPEELLWLVEKIRSQAGIDRTLSTCISGPAQSTAHFPEPVLNNFVTRLGHAIGRVLRTMFPRAPVPRLADGYAAYPARFPILRASQAALQEVGPRFTLKLRSLSTGLPAVKETWEPSTKLEFGGFDNMVTDGGQPEGKVTNQPPHESGGTQ